MNMTPLYIGIGVGVTAALAYGLYKYLTRGPVVVGPEVVGPVVVGPEVVGPEVVGPEVDQDDFLQIDTVTYETLLKWLKVQSQEGIAQSGDSFVIFQNLSASPMFKEAFPHKASLLKSHRCIAIAVAHGDEIKKARFYLYKKISSSLSEMLPDDKNKAFVQNIVR